ncbi:MAG: hypothetical protein QXK24_08850 [Ignisphaera sp.]
MAQTNISDSVVQMNQLINTILSIVVLIAVISLLVSALKPK